MELFIVEKGSAGGEGHASNWCDNQKMHKDAPSYVAWVGLIGNWHEAQRRTGLLRLGLRIFGAFSGEQSSMCNGGPLWGSMEGVSRRRISPRPAPGLKRR